MLQSQALTLPPHNQVLTHKMKRTPHLVSSHLEAKRKRSLKEEPAMMKACPRNPLMKIKGRKRNF